MAVTSQASLSALVTDDKGVSKVTYYYGSSTSGPWTEIGLATRSSGTALSGTWTFSWNLTNLAAGTYYVRAVAVDTAGKTAQAVVGHYIKSTASASVNYILNGDFTSGKTSWIGSGVLVKTESNGNAYGAAAYGWNFYQEIKLAPGQYRLSALAKKGTAASEARIVVMFIDSAGNRTVNSDILYKPVGTGWETIPAKTITVPQNAVTTRVYLLTNGGSGYQCFDKVRLEKL